MDRNKEIIKTSVIGMTGNLVLSAFKMVIGFAANSVSINADAINNAADSLSSVITIIGTRLAEREPDRKHPFGYGRIEYLSSLFIGLSILYAGMVSIVSSFRRILRPQPNDFSVVTIIVVVVGIIVKIMLGIYTRQKGEKLDSVALIASGKDAMNDSIASAATLAAAILYMVTGLSVEAYVALIISFLIMKNGIDTLHDTVSSLLGEQVDVELAAAVKKSILSFPEVYDVFDLAIHNYGKQTLIGSAHIEIPDGLTAAWVDNLQRAITKKVFRDTGIQMLGITIYAVNSKDVEAIAMRESVRRIAEEDRLIRSIHGFYLDKVDRTISFEAEIDFETENADMIRENLTRRIQEKYPGYDVSIKMNRNIEDSESTII